MGNKKESSKKKSTNKANETQPGNDARNYPAGANRTGGQHTK